MIYPHQGLKITVVITVEENDISEYFTAWFGWKYSEKSLLHSDDAKSLF